MHTKTIDFNGASLFYRVTGTGKPVLLIHGFGEDGEVWNRQWTFLQDYFTLIIPDLPGSGRSGMIADMSIEGMAEAIKHVLNTELLALNTGNMEGICVIGHSMGGYITWHSPKNTRNSSTPLAYFILLHLPTMKKRKPPV